MISDVADLVDGAVDFVNEGFQIFETVCFKVVDLPGLEQTNYLTKNRSRDQLNIQLITIP